MGQQSHPFLDGRGEVASSTQLLVPLGQSLGSQMWRLDAYDIAAGRSLKTRGYAAAGVGGRTIAEISKGATAFVGNNCTFVIYDRFMRMVTRAKELGSLYGRPTIIDCIEFLHGEADATSGTSLATYKAAVLQLIADLRADIPVITGQSNAIDFIFDIVAGPPISGGTSGAAALSALAQVEIARENADGRTFTIGPNHYLPFAPDGLPHHTREGVVILAEAFARARSIRAAAGTPDFLYKTGQALVGSTITIDCHVPVGNLVIDRATMPAMTGTNGAGKVFVDGFEFTDGSNRTITDVSVSGSQITIQLSGVPSGTKTLSYAYNGLGSIDYTDPVTVSANFSAPSVVE